MVIPGAAGGGAHCASHCWFRRCPRRPPTDGRSRCAGAGPGRGPGPLGTDRRLYVIPGIAGAIVGWAVMLALGPVWSGARHTLFVRRFTAGFAVAALALFWVVLASRQLLGIIAHIHLSLAASIRAGGPHAGASLEPRPIRPVPLWCRPADRAAGPAVRTRSGVCDGAAGRLRLDEFRPDRGDHIQRGSWLVVLVVSPLLLTTGAWTLIFTTPPDIVRIPVPTGVPMEGLRMSLAEIGTRPSTPGKLRSKRLLATSGHPFSCSPTRWCVVLERAAGSSNRSWLAHAVLALLIGFLGLVDETVALIALALWIVLEAVRFLAGVRVSAHRSRSALRAAAGPVLATLLLAGGGGVVTGVLTGLSGSGLSLGWIADANSRQPLGSLTALSGSVGVVGLGVVPVAVAAVLLGWRDRLALALAIGGGVLLLAALTLQYEFSRDIARLDGHARNFVLLASLSRSAFVCKPCGHDGGMPSVRFALITWPTVVAPAHSLGLTWQRATVHEPSSGARRAPYALRGPPPYRAPDVRRCGRLASTRRLTRESFPRSNRDVHSDGPP